MRSAEGEGEGRPQASHPGFQGEWTEEEPLPPLRSSSQHVLLLPHAACLTATSREGQVRGGSKG